MTLFGATAPVGANVVLTGYAEYARGSGIFFGARLAADGVLQHYLAEACPDGHLPRLCAAALAETVIGLFKTEVIRRRGPWRSLETVEFAALEWVDWYNNRRLLEPLGNVPPAEAEARYYERLDAPALAA